MDGKESQGLSLAATTAGDQTDGQEVARETEEEQPERQEMAWRARGHEEGRGSPYDGRPWT